MAHEIGLHTTRYIHTWLAALYVVRFDGRWDDRAGYFEGSVTKEGFIQFLEE